MSCFRVTIIDKGSCLWYNRHTESREGGKSAMKKALAIVLTLIGCLTIIALGVAAFLF